MWHQLEADYKLGRKLGSGSYGHVYRITIDGEAYALKVTEVGRELEAVNELDTMVRLSHPYLLSCVGMKKGQSLEMILPLALCDLRTFAVKYRPSQQELLRLYYQVAVGLEFLHQQDLIHLDLNHNNILVFREDGQYLARIGDFGLVINSNKKEVINRELVTASFRAPESFQYRAGYPYSRANDVWSLGMTILRTMNTRIRPFTDSIDQLVAKLKKGLVTKTISGQLGVLVNQMLAISPSDRPTISQVVNELSRLSGHSQKPVGSVKVSAIEETEFLLSENRIQRTQEQTDLSQRERIIDDYRVLDRMSYTAYRMGLASSILFLAVDLYYRTHGDSLLRGLACLGLAIKVKGHECDYAMMSPLFGVVGKIRPMELEIIWQVKGTINVPTLWHRTTDPVSTYELLRDVRIYQQALQCPIISPPKDESFVKFYPRTQYYQWMESNKELNEEKIQQLYQHENELDSN